jgi:hypothetical protein
MIAGVTFTNSLLRAHIRLKLLSLWSFVVFFEQKHREPIKTVDSVAMS